MTHACAQVMTLECENRRCSECPFELLEAGPSPRFMFICGCECHHSCALSESEKDAWLEGEEE